MPLVLIRSGSGGPEGRRRGRPDHPLHRRIGRLRNLRRLPSTSRPRSRAPARRRGAPHGMRAPGRPVRPSRRMLCVHGYIGVHKDRTAAAQPAGCGSGHGRRRDPQVAVVRVDVRQQERARRAREDLVEGAVLLDAGGAETAPFFWPAWWLLGQDDRHGWPRCGEIDIMEAPSSASTHGQVHQGTHSPHSGGQGAVGVGVTPTISSWGSDFQSMLIDWVPIHDRARRA
jgi:hypothetical protein